MGDTQDRGLSDEELQALSGGTTQESLSAEKDTLSDLSAESQLKLQQYMDQKTTTESMLSNIMKKASDTASQIASNLKG